MAVRYRRPVSHAATWSSRLAVFALLILVVAAVAHRLGLMQTMNFISLGLLATGLAALALLLALTGLASLWFIGARGGRAAFRGFVVALLLLLPAGYLAMRYMTLPPLAEVSTDTDTVPDYLAETTRQTTWLAPHGLTGAPAWQAQALAYPELSGRRYEGAIDRVLQGVEIVAAARGFAITDVSGAQLAPDGGTPLTELPDTPELMPGESVPALDLSQLQAPLPVPRPQEPGAAPPPSSRVTLQAEVPVTPLALLFDVVIRLVEEEETTFVDVRSAARFGGPDLGLNVQVIEGFLRALDAELLGIAPEG
jgi:hypothetical protein